MNQDNTVATHYSTGRMLDRLREGIARLGKTPETVTVDDLAPVDEFHVGGRQATLEFCEQLGWKEGQHLLDVGCGIGGTARFVASRYGVRVAGIDLTPEFVAVGDVVNQWLGLRERIALHAGSALKQPFERASFDGAYMLHVGMNIADKAALFTEVSRVLRPGSTFGIYDLMRTGDGEIGYPVPWADSAGSSAVATTTEYQAALHAAGFDLLRSRNRRDFAVAFFGQMQAKLAATGTPPPVGLHLYMESRTQQKLGNVLACVKAGTLAPVEMIARKRG